MISDRRKLVCGVLQYLWQNSYGVVVKLLATPEYIPKVRIEGYLSSPRVSGWNGSWRYCIFFVLSLCIGNDMGEVA